MTARRARGLARRLDKRLRTPVDGASLAVFRMLFGVLMCVSTVRFMASGWIERFYGGPEFFFKYWGLSWVPVAPVSVIYVVYGALAVLALLVALGLFYRVSIVLWFVGFTYTQALDVTNYLNHYYLIVLLSSLMCFMPLHRVWSLDAVRDSRVRGDTVPTWALYLLRFQVGVVYCFAGLAKLSSDWLLYAQPLNVWLSARIETPIIGPLFDELWVAYAFSWGGFLFDSTIVLWLSWARTRPYAYAVLIGFHLMTGVLFNIGMFPYIMMLSALVFFSPSWPRRFVRTQPPAAIGRHESRGSRYPRLARVGVAAAVVYCALQILVPLRHYAYPGNVLWNEQGMRFSWKVMLREKHGSVTYYVDMPSGKQLQVSPGRYLDTRQEREMAGQPDLIVQLGRHIARDFRARGYGDVAVRAEVLVSLNGRPAQLMLDPSRDLTRVDDGLAPADWILPGPEKPPLQLWSRTNR